MNSPRGKTSITMIHVIHWAWEIKVIAWLMSSFCKYLPFSQRENVMSLCACGRKREKREREGAECVQISYRLLKVNTGIRSPLKMIYVQKVMTFKQLWHIFP